VAFLGSGACLELTVSDLTASRSAWEAVGFSEITHGLLTDGQIVVGLQQGPVPALRLVYSASAPHRLVQVLTDKGLPSQRDGEGATARLADVLDVYIDAERIRPIPRPERTPNPICGYLDTLVIGVDNLDIARRSLEAAGFFVIEQWQGDFPQIDMTDGLITIGLRLGRTQTPFLVYESEDIDGPQTYDVHPNLRILVAPEVIADDDDVEDGDEGDDGNGDDDDGEGHH